MPLVTPAQPDALRPTVEQALEAWARRVRAEREQVERLHEVADPDDFYAPVAGRFRMDPRRAHDRTVDALEVLARPDDTWLDIGAGGGRYALPIALVSREVICVEPSPGMRDVLATSADEHDIRNVRVHAGSWPPDGWPDAADMAPFHADVALMAHVGYDIELIGPFLDAADLAARRLCVAVVGEGAMTTTATLFWESVHGERRVPLPALPELLALLLARGSVPEVRLVERVPPTFESRDELMAMAARQLWVVPGSARYAVLERLVLGRVTEHDGSWALDWSATRIGVVTWEPRAARP